MLDYDAFEELLARRGPDWTGDFLCEGVGTIELRDLIFEMHALIGRLEK